MSSKEPYKINNMLVGFEDRSTFECTKGATMIVYSLIISDNIRIFSDHIRYYPSALFSEEIAEDHSIPMRKEIELDFEALDPDWFAACFFCEKLDKFLKVRLIIKRRFDIPLHPHVRTSSKDARLDLFPPRNKAYQPSPITIKALSGSRRTSHIVRTVMKNTNYFRWHCHFWASFIALASLSLMFILYYLLARDEERRMMGQYGSSYEGHVI